MTDPDRGLLEGPIPRADGPARLLEAAHDRLRGLAVGQLEARHRPAASPFAGRVRHAALLAPRFHARAHRVVAPPARFDAALALDAPELGLERVQERDRGRVGRL